MHIHFFEEFPNKENLEKLKLITWPTALYVAAPSLTEFRNIQKIIHNPKIKEYIYWPILKKEEGYWISPWSKREALQRIFKELRGKKVKVMIDAEMPTSQNPKLLLTELPHFMGNRKIIRKFIQDYQQCSVAEYYPEGRLKETALSIAGLHFDPRKYNNTVIKMVYHSMHRFDEKFITTELKLGKQRWGAKFAVALGVLSTGVQGKEQLLSTEQLEEDLRICKEVGIDEVIIYRSGGLTKEYVKVIKKFL